MAKQSNFKTAVNELMNGVLGETGDDSVEESGTSQGWQAPSKFMETVRMGGQDMSRKPGGSSVIAEDLIIEGNIFGDSTIQINGKVKGNVSITGDIVAKGIIEGDAKGNNVTLNKSNIRGNVSASRLLSVDSESVIVGNISGSSIEVDGKVKGDIHAEEIIVLKKSAVVFGNVEAKTISMEAGAALKGKLNVLASNINDGSFAFDKIGKPSSAIQDGFGEKDEDSKEE